MITKKLWNSLTQSRRKRIIDFAFFTMNENFRNEMSKEFHHNFSYKSKGNEPDGEWYKILFNKCTLLPTGQIKVTLNYEV